MILKGYEGIKKMESKGRGITRVSRLSMPEGKGKTKNHSSKNSYLFTKLFSYKGSRVVFIDLSNPHLNLNTR